MFSYFDVLIDLDLFANNFFLNIVLWFWTRSWVIVKNILHYFPFVWLEFITKHCNYVRSKCVLLEINILMVLGKIQKHKIGINASLYCKLIWILGFIISDSDIWSVFAWIIFNCFNLILGMGMTWGSIIPKRIYPNQIQMRKKTFLRTLKKFQIWETCS